MTKHIFIIDDDPISVVILKKNLELIHIMQKINTFSNGKEALTYFNEEYRSQEEYLIFLDINMPQMDGWDFLNEIEPFVAKQNTTIFLLTSSINKQDMDKATQFSLIEKYLSKPISKEMLIEIKEKFID